MKEKVKLQEIVQVIPKKEKVYYTKNKLFMSFYVDTHVLQVALRLVDRSLREKENSYKLSKNKKINFLIKKAIEKLVNEGYDVDGEAVKVLKDFVI